MIRSASGCPVILMKSMTARGGGYLFADCQRNRVAAGGLFLGWLVALLCAQGATAGLQKSFCGDGLARDYLAPFARMPKVTPPPQSGRLPFAPPHTVLNRSESPVLVPGIRGGSEFSYSFEADPGSGRRFVLNWTIKARLLRVDQSGQVERAVNVQWRRVGKVSEAEFNRIVLRFPIDSQPAFYRLDTTFRRISGQVLAHYSEYIRVVKPKYNARLAVSAAIASPGDTLYFRIKNPGTEQLRFGEAFSIEQFNGGAWVDYPADIGPWRSILLSLSAGQLGKCQSFTIPLDMPTGRYRVRKNLLREARHPLTAEFEVHG